MVSSLFQVKYLGFQDVPCNPAYRHKQFVSPFKGMHVVSTCSVNQDLFVTTDGDHQPFSANSDNPSGEW